MLKSNVVQRLRARVLRDVSIQRKLTLLTLITSGVTLVLAGVAYVTYDLFAFRQAMERDRLILAQIVGSNSTAALAFDDAKAGTATLASLSAQPRIVAACLFNKDGRVFASYRAEERPGPVLRAGECPVVGRGHMEVSQPIILDGESIGSIAIESDLLEFYARLGRYASIGVLAILVSSFVGWRLSLRLQQAISTPILNLVKTARAVSENMDYSVRAVKYGADEIGLLIGGFNDMLEQIEKRDAALTELSKNLNQLYRLSTALQEPLSLPEQIDRVLEGARQVVAVDRFYIWAVAPDRQVLTPLGGAGFTQEELKDFADVEIPLTQAGAMYKAYLEGISLVFNDANPLPAELRLKEPYSQLKAIQSSSFIVIPMIARGDPVGLFTADNKRSGQPILAETVGLLQIFALHAAVAIQNARLFNEIQDKSRELEMANKHKSEFLANMSHELRTPLNAIIGFSEVLSEKMFGDLNDKQLEYLLDIHTSGHHLLTLINDILDLSKIEAGRMELDLSSVNLPMLLDNCTTLVRERASRQGLELRLEVEAGLGDWVADIRKLKQIVINLLSNAVKFTPAGGRVTLRARRVGPAVEIAVVDTGVGIAADQQALVFEEFRQAGGDYLRKSEGTGLGLPLAKRFVELHGGAMRILSEPGMGSTFAFILPELVLEAV